MADYISIWKCVGIGLGPSGEAIVNTFHFGITTAEDPSLQAVDIATPWQTVWEAQIISCVTADWRSYGVSASCILGANAGKSTFLGGTAGLVGSLAAPSAPLQVAAIGRRYSTGSGRHNRGRCFIGPVPSSSIDVNGVFTPPGGWLIAWQGLALSQIIAGAVAYDPVMVDVATTTGAMVTTANFGSLAGQIRRRRVRLPN